MAGVAQKAGLCCMVMAWASTCSADDFGPGISPDLRVHSETISNLAGGIKQGSVADLVAKFGLAWSSRRAGLWSGGRLVVTAEGIEAGNPENYVGDVQGVSNLTTHSMGHLYKAYYRQALSRLIMRIGLINPNDYFNDAGVCGDLFNASFGIMPVISGNLPGTPTYPYSSLGVMASYAWGTWTVQTGLFGADGFHPFQHPVDRGGISYLELDHTAPAGPGKYTLKGGIWYNRQATRYATVLGPQTAGWYGIGEYRWKESGLDWAGFLQLGSAPQPVNPIPWYLGAGLRLRGFWPAQPKDTVSMGMARAWIRGAPHAETSLELNDLVPIDRHVSIQPDLQYVIHPSGVNPAALVFILRVNIHFS